MKFENISPGPLVGADAYKVGPRVGMAVLAIFVFYGLQIGVFFAVGKESWNTMWMLGAHGVTAVALFLLALIQLRNRGGARALVGHNVLPALRIFLTAVLAAYLVCAGLDIAFGFGRENFMVQLFVGMSDVQKALCLLMLVLFPPVSEELLYRHFVIGVFPLHHRTWQWVAVLFTGGLFVVAHSQYDHWPTILLIGVLGVMFAIARVRTGGILVPVAMHCAAEVIGMSTDWALGKLL